MTADDLPPFPEIPLSPESRLRWLAWGRECMAKGMERAMEIGISEAEYWQKLSDKGHGCKCGKYIAGAIREVTSGAIRSELPRNQEG